MYSYPYIIGLKKVLNIKKVLEVILAPKNMQNYEKKTEYERKMA
jgi:hypothetical protein